MPPTLAPLDMMDQFQAKSRRILADFREVVERAGKGFVTAFDTSIHLERGSTQHAVTGCYPAAPAERGGKWVRSGPGRTLARPVRAGPPRPDSPLAARGHGC